jgi:hypothetical protein
MSGDGRKARVREVMRTSRPTGLYAVRNKKTGRLLLGPSRDLPGMLNRQRFQLEMGSHPDRGLQADWNELGPDAFTFETLDELEAPSSPNADPSEDLRTLHRMWLEKLTEDGTALYRRSTAGL